MQCGLQTFVEVALVLVFYSQVTVTVGSVDGEWEAWMVSAKPDLDLASRDSKFLSVPHEPLQEKQRIFQQLIGASQQRM